MNENSKVGSSALQSGKTLTSLMGNTAIPSALGTTVTGALKNIPFRFGIDADGNYGYYKAGADSVTPFKSGGEIIELHKTSSGGPPSTQTPTAPTTYTLTEDYSYILCIGFFSNDASNGGVTFNASGYVNLGSVNNKASGYSIWSGYRYGYIRNAKSGLVISCSWYWGGGAFIFGVK